MCMEAPHPYALTNADGVNVTATLVVQLAPTTDDEARPT